MVNKEILAWDLIDSACRSNEVFHNGSIEGNFPPPLKVWTACLEILKTAFIVGIFLYYLVWRPFQSFSRQF